MMDTLRAEVLPPRHQSPWVRILAIAVGCGLAGGGIVVSTLLSRDARVTVVAPSPAPPVESARVISSELRMVFHAGGHAYIKLGPAEGMSHGKPTLFNDDGLMTAIADIDSEHVPTDTLDWLQRKIIIDNDCTATVTKFKVVSRLTGDIGYSGSKDKEWSAPSVMDQGAQMLVGELDRCDGTYARSARLPLVVVPQRLTDDPVLIAKARKALLASNAASETDEDWVDSDEKWRNDALFDTRVLKHPITGQTWISIHAYNDHECGDPEINLWGLYRVMPDGALDPVQVRKLGDMVRIDQIIDIEGDGELELIGHTWLGDQTLVTRGSSEEIESLSLPYFGCPC